MRTMSAQRDKAEKFRALHRSGHPLLLVNVWDAVSARIIEELGSEAIATTSAGIAWAEGFADGERITREHMLARVERVAQAVKVPLSADLEGAYGSSVEDALKTAEGAIAAGAVGLNFEDAQDDAGTLVDLELQAARISGMRDVATKRGVPLVINARTDVFLASVGDDDTWRLAEAVRRGNRYLEAGADCVFVPGISGEPTIADIVRGLKGPLNVLAGAKTPSLERLAELGVARVSVGSGAHGYVLAQFRAIASSMRGSGTFDVLAARISHAQLNALFEGSKVSA